MKRASYREDRDSVEDLAGYASVVLVSEIFGVESTKVASDVWRERDKERIAYLRSTAV